MKEKDITEKNCTEVRIMDAAERLFLKNGYNRTTTTAIAEQAGVTHAMLHYYYRSKEQIFARVIDKNLDELLASFHPVMKKGATFWETLESGISTHFDFLMKHPELPAFILDTMRFNPELLENHKPRIRKTLLRITGFHYSIINDEIAAGRIRKTDPEQLLLDIIMLNLSAFIMLPAAANVFPEIGGKRMAGILEERKKEIITLIKSRLYREI